MGMRPSRVGLVYDPIYLEHDTGQHVENAERLRSVIRLLDSENLREKLVPVQPRPATIEELTLAHSQELISRVESMCQMGGGWLDADTVTSPRSFEVALYAVGGVIQAVEAVVKGEVDSAFALVRPPGHHATYWRAMGFCLFNNVAIAAKYALTQLHLDKILIIDFDVHHGNGTQDAFYTSPHVLYFSTHQFPHYPGTGSLNEIGDREGLGNIVNVPLPPGCGDEEYERIFLEVLAPLARRFRPELILVSAGYDAHWADSLAMMQLSVSGYATMATIIKNLAQELCRRRLVFSLEGGYHLQVLAASVGATIGVLLGNAPPPDPLGPSPQKGSAPSIEGLLREVKRIHGLA